MTQETTEVNWLDTILSWFAPRRPAPTPDAAAAVVRLVNAFRASHGLGPLAMDPRLEASAQAHALDMATRVGLSHTGSDGSEPGTRMIRAGYPWAEEGECIARGQPGPAAVVAAWERDPPHAAILLGDYAHVGVGRAGMYWCLDAGRTS